MPRRKPDENVRFRKTKPPALETWDFSGCPDEETDLCCWYEYSSESDEMKERVARALTSDHLSHLDPGDADFYRIRWMLEFARLFPEFPDTPWLCIPERERKARCEELWKWDGPFMHVAPRRLGGEDDDYPFHPDDCPEGYHVVYAIEVDWSASDDAIIKAFKRWLAANKPSEGIHQDKTGQISPRELLKALGAFRLLREANNSLGLASYWAQQFGKGAWAPKYQDDKSWRNARKKACQMITRGTPVTPSQVFLEKLDLSQLEAREQIIAKVRIARLNRQELRNLGKLKGEKLLAKIREDFGREPKGTV